MTRSWIIAALIYLVGLLQFSLNAQSTAFIPPEDGKPPFTTAVDAKGVAHSSRNYIGRYPPWTLDCVKTEAPYYSYDDRLRRHQGIGFFKLSLDLKTGVVRKITLLKTTGFSTLDNSAVAALGKWRWRPGKWREIEIPVRFQISTSPAPADAIRIPNP